MTESKRRFTFECKLFLVKCRFSLLLSLSLIHGASAEMNWTWTKWKVKKWATAKIAILHLLCMSIETSQGTQKCHWWLVTSSATVVTEVMFLIPSVWLRGHRALVYFRAWCRDLLIFILNECLYRHSFNNVWIQTVLNNMRQIFFTALFVFMVLGFSRTAWLLY